MKTNFIHKMVVGAAVMALAGGHAIGQTVGPPATGPNTAVAGNAAASNLPFGVPEILKLCQAKVSEGTVVAFVQNSGDSYNLNADQIVWLRQRGVSDAVLTAMLSQPRAGVATGRRTQIIIRSPARWICVWRPRPRRSRARAG